MNNNNFYLPSSRSFVEEFNVMKLLADANKLEEKGKKIYHFELGEPQPNTPSKVTKELEKLITKKIPGYTPSNGIEILRNKISKFYKDKYNLGIDPNQIFVTTGSSGAFLLTFLSCFDAGNKVAIFNPVYPAYRNILKSLNIKVLEINSDEKNNFEIDVGKIKKFKGIDGLIISNPNNPTGQVLNANELRFIYQYCETNKIKLICDEIYHGIEYERKSNSILSFGKNAFVINSFSKYFCMPGWRLGWAIVPNELTQNFLRLSQNLFISSGNIAQLAAVRIFDCITDLDKVVQNYKLSRNLIFKELSRFDRIKFKKPAGSFYYYLNISNLSNNSVKFARKLLNDTGIVITPGIDFDKENGLTCVRLAFSIDNKVVKEGLKKFSRWLSACY